MARRVLTLCGDLVKQDALAAAIACKYDQWDQAREKKMKDHAEVGRYVFATDTTTTSNSSLPWKNKTVRPKLCQIRDNLHANYMAALFPNEDYFQWDAGDEDSASKEKAEAITLYMKTKLKQSRFEDTVSRFIYDLIDYGNVFGTSEYVAERIYNEDGTLKSEGYVGPRAVRLSPYDVVFDPTAASFDRTPKIVRSLLTFGDIKKLMKTDPTWEALPPELITKMLDTRKQVVGTSRGDLRKSESLKAAGYSDITQYYSSGLVEVLEFEGDLYLEDSAELLESRNIIIVDRAYVVKNETIDTWTGQSLKQHCGWRLRSDNLWAMGPLDNLVGMQYRIDHLENLKADVFDLIAYPVSKVKGYVEDFQYRPLERIYMDVDSDVEFMSPDTTALNADMQIRELEDQMEDMAGAPKQAMGIRTPGEKTKFEVQALENSAGRIFQNKITYFEKNFLEPLLNGMLEQARRNMDAVDSIKYVDPDLGVTEFLQITKEDLKSKGKLVPIGARHFAAQAQLIQNLTSLSATPVYQDPAVQVHFSGIKMAKLLEENLGLTQYGVVQPNIRIMENAQTQKLAQTAQDQNQAEAVTPPLTEEDIPEDAEEPTAF